MTNRTLRRTAIGLALVACASAVGVIIAWRRWAAKPPEASFLQPQCGQWCVLRCSQLLGAPVDMAKVAQMLPDDKSGHNMLQLAEALEEIGFEVEGRRETFKTLSAGTFPCIAHLTDPDHFVVVSGLEEDRVHVFDGSGRRTARTAQGFQEKWGGEVLFVRRVPGGAPLPAFLPQPSQPSPCIQFETLLLDKGTVPAVGETVEFVYPFENRGTTDLTIEGVETDCSCLGSKKPEEPIPPGGRGDVTLSYHVRAKRGVFSHKAVVTTNDPRVRNIVLQASGYTGIEVTVEPRTLRLGEIPGGRPHAARLFIRNTSDWAYLQIEQVALDLEGASLVEHSCRNIEGPLARKLSPGAPRELRVPDNARVLEVSILPSSSLLGEVRGTLTIRTNVKEYEQFSIPVIAHVVTPVWIRPSVLHFGEVYPDDNVQRTVTLVPIAGEPFQILGLQPAPAGLQAAFPESVIHGEAEIRFSATGASVLESAEDTLGIRVRLVDSGEELSIPLKLSAWPRNDPRSE